MELEFAERFFAKKPQVAVEAGPKNAVLARDEESQSIFSWFGVSFPSLAVENEQGARGDEDPPKFVLQGQGFLGIRSHHLRGDDFHRGEAGCGGLPSSLQGMAKPSSDQGCKEVNAKADARCAHFVNKNIGRFGRTPQFLDTPSFRWRGPPPLLLGAGKIRSFSKAAFRQLCAKVAGMKSINHAINGLASSLLLTVGLTSAAEKFDTVSSLAAKNDAASEDCVWLCYFQAESAR